MTARAPRDSAQIGPPRVEKLSGVTGRMPVAGRGATPRLASHRSTAVRAAKFHALLVSLRGEGWLLREIADLTGLGEPNVFKHLRGQCRCVTHDSRRENGYQPR